MKREFGYTVCLILAAILGMGALDTIAGAELLVPSQYATIQEAVQAAQSGDSVIIADGIYTGTGNKNIDFDGKPITVRSENGAENCIIEIDQDYARGFIFNSGETGDSIVRGLTIRNGSFPLNSGGAINCIGTSPVITECVFTNNFAMFGGAVHLENSSALITHCVFDGNTADVSSPSLGAEGGGADCYAGGTPLFFNCLFINNWAKSFGGGISMDNADPIIVNCTFTANTCEIGAGVCGRSADPVITNCIIWGNPVEEIFCTPGDPVINYTCIQRDTPWPGTGNIILDPLLITGPLGLGYLSAVSTGQSEDSPCFDAGDLPASDICDGNPLICLDALTTMTDNTTDSGIADMGYHFPLAVQGSPTATPSASPSPTPTIHPTTTPSPPTDTPTMTPTATFTPTPTPTFSSTATSPPPPTHTPTPPPPTDTPTYPPTDTPTASSTPTPPTHTPTHSPTATATPLIRDLGVYINLSGSIFHPGDIFDLTVTVANPGPDEYMFQPFALVLDAYGTYIWYPDWTETFMYERVNVDIGESMIDILTFTWPDVNGSADGIYIYAALLSQDLKGLLGYMDGTSFGWAP